MPKAAINMEQSAEQATLKEIFNYLASAEKRCCIAIDEFQQIAEYSEKGIEALLRSYIQFVPNANFIFAGSRQHVMKEMFLSAKRTFYQSAQTLAIGSIDKEEYHHFAEHLFTEQHHSLPQDVFEQIYTRFDGHTWYIQAILNRLFGYRMYATTALVDYAIGEIVNESVYSYENIISSQSQASIKLLKAIAKERFIKEITAGDFIAKY